MPFLTLQEGIPQNQKDNPQETNEETIFFY